MAKANEDKKLLGIDPIYLGAAVGGGTGYATAPKKKKRMERALMGAIAGGFVGTVYKLLNK